MLAMRVLFENAYTIDAPLTLKGQGITFVTVLTKENLIFESRNIGWNRYKVTEKAFKKLITKYAVFLDSIFD
jgi:hypothetical protein